LYTLIKPPSETNPEPEVHRIVLGGDVTRGETNQLFVPGGWWKASEIPAEDMKLLAQPGAEEGLKERIGCLISEVVIPGWTPDQHVFIDEQKVSGSHLTGEMRGRR
jgi:predicted cupin superfamily sugar epimerase